MMKSTDKLLQDYLKSDKNINEILSEKKLEKPKEEIKPLIKEESIEIPTPIIAPEPVKIEEKIIEEKKVVVIEEKIIRNDVSDIFLNEIAELKSDIDMLKEAVVEILNFSVKNNDIFKERLQKNLDTSRKKIIFNRDNSGKIISADLQEDKIEEKV